VADPTSRATARTAGPLVLVVEHSFHLVNIIVLIVAVAAIN